MVSMMDPYAPIFLIGYRGTGKSTVARLLAERLKWDSIDADDEVEIRAGKTIAGIFAQQGERSFRDLEANVVAALCRRQRVVISLGGGAILREESRQAVRRAGQVVWLTAEVDTIESRLAADATTAQRRPNLTAAGGRAEIEVHLAEREPKYRECATLVVVTDGKTSAEVADEIMDRLPQEKAGKQERQD
jgi:shikimate kinase